jgi:hypothetical protein
MIPQTTYMIFPVSELDKIDFSLVGETSQDTVRKSVDGTLTFITWVGTSADMPEFLNTVAGTQGPYTYEEILLILAGPDWTPELFRGV